MTEPSDPAMQERVARLEERLGLPAGALPARFALEALRHGSFAHERRLAGEDAPSNERLEFLGDAVLGVAVARRLWELLPGESEGALTRVRAAIVNEDALANVARAAGLGELLLLGRGEELTGGRDKQSLLADAFEAVLAAVYLGCGSEAALGVVDRLLGPLLAQAAEGKLGRDFKTELQESAQAARRPSPIYRVVAAPGPQHARTFEVEVTLGGESFGRGQGKSKKEAEQAAARAALAFIAAQPPPAPPSEEAAPPTPAGPPIDGAG
jgi:ribonuclease-3